MLSMVRIGGGSACSGFIGGGGGGVWNKGVPNSSRHSWKCNRTISPSLNRASQNNVCDIQAKESRNRKAGCNHEGTIHHG